MGITGKVTGCGHRAEMFLSQKSHKNTTEQELIGYLNVKIAPKSVHKQAPTKWFKRCCNRLNFKNVSIQIYGQFRKLYFTLRPGLLLENTVH